MHNPAFRNISASMIAIMLLVFLESGCCQKNQSTDQKPQAKTQAAGGEQTQQIRKILSGYNASKLTAEDAKAIQGKFRDAGIHAGPEINAAIISAGFDPEKLRTLAPPPDSDGKGKPGPASMDERLKRLEDNIIKPLALTTAQKETVTNAFKDFYTEVDKLHKTQSNPQQPIEKTKMEPLEKARDVKIKQALTATQYTKYLELEKASRPKRPDDKGTKH